MKILAAKIRTYSEFDNLPTLEVLVDKIPDNESLVYEQKGNSYFAEKEGYVSFFYYSRPDEGYGGTVFTINTKGGLKDLHGPWSSNSEAMYQAGFQRSVNVSITDDPKAFERGYTFNAGYLTLEKFAEACAIAKCVIAQDKHGFIISMPSCEDCGYLLTQKYRTLDDITQKYPKVIRKMLCKTCSTRYNLGTSIVSREVSYEIKHIKRSTSNSLSHEQISILG